MATTTKIITVIIFILIGCNNGQNSIEKKEFQLELLWNYGFEYSSAPTAEPIIDGDNVYTTGGPGLHKLSRYSGEKTWYTKYASLASSLLGENYVHTNEHIIGLVPNQVLCFSKQSGEIIWERTLLEYNYLSHMGYSSKFEDYFYIGSETGNLFKINITDGIVDEIANLEHYIRDTYALNHDKFLLSDIIHSDSVNITNIGVYSISEKNWLWKRTAYNIGYFSGSISIIDDEKVYIGATRGYFGCLDINTGEVIWENYSKELYSRNFIVSGEKIFVNCIDEVISLDKNTGNILWIADKVTTSNSAKLHEMNGYVYWAHWAGIYIYDAETGEKVHYHKPSDGAYIRTATITDSAYYVQTSFNLFKYKLLAEVE